MRRALCLLLSTVGWATCWAQPGAFNFAALQSLLQREHIDTVERLVAALPEEQRSHYALMFASRSLQGASFDHPRVILFGPDARFMLTFNGSSEQLGFNTVETMEFDDRTKQFRLRELLFTPPTTEGLPPVVVSATNPARCARCHGTPAQPVWDTLPLWPGAYGERYRASLSARERAGLAVFLAAQPTHPRYGLLLGAQRFADSQSFRPTALSNYGGRAPEPPNAELATALAGLQAQAIARRLAQQPAFPEYQYALLGVADNSCGQLADFYPATLWRVQRHALERFAADTTAANARQARAKATRAGGGSSRLPLAEVSNDNAWVPLRFVAETALGIPTRAWTLALERHSYDFTLPPLATQPLREALLIEVAARDPTVRDLSRYASAAGGDRYCTYLQRRSLAMLSSTAAPPDPAHPVGGAVSASPPATALNRPAALQLCISCHEDGSAPAVPFSDPIQLSTQLRARPATHGTLLDEIHFRLSPTAGPQHMPLGTELPDAERESLENYFATLAASSN